MVEDTQQIYQDVECIFANAFTVQAARPPKKVEEVVYKTSQIIQASRLESKMTIDELSHATKIPQITLKRFEAGTEVPDICAMRILEIHLNKNMASSSYSSSDPK